MTNFRIGDQVIVSPDSSGVYIEHREEGRMVRHHLAGSLCEVVQAPRDGRVLVEVEIGEMKPRVFLPCRELEY